MIPTRTPTKSPTLSPTLSPTPQPTITRYPTSQPSSQPSATPSSVPSAHPTSEPTVSKEPTSHPTGRPTSYPTNPKPTVRPTTPTSQPTSQPTRQPSSQPTRLPTTKPTSSPTKIVTKTPSKSPSAKPTISPDTPSSQPTSCPTMRPTGQPTSIPTFPPTISFEPTSPPTARPSGRPSIRPTTSWGTSLSPTAVYLGYNTTGSVSFDPDELKLCQDVEIDIKIKIYRNMSYGSRLFIRTPGITSGACISATNGHNISSLLLYDDSVFSIKFVEGNYTNNFLGSFLLATISTKSFIPGHFYQILIDRGNGLKRSCLFNSSWEVDIRTSGYRISTGYLKVYETYPKLCFFYNSSLTFTHQYQQYPTGINVSFQPAFKFDNDTFFMVSLPGFTNQISNYPLYNMNYNFSSVGDVLAYAQNATLSNLQYNTNYSWTGKWIEGNSTQYPFNSSYLLLYPEGSQEYLVNIWVYIGKYDNHILPLCGRPANYEGFIIQAITTSSTFYTNATRLATTSAIGTGCSLMNGCSNNGECDYCHSKCKCFDGYGSDRDKKHAIADDFQRDCSSKTCPLGPARGISRDEYNGDMHRLIECSSNGRCNRDTGKCLCFHGFSGSACDKQTCPGTPTCSGRGQCLPMSVLATRTDSIPLQTNSTYYSRKRVNGSNYEAWDSEFGHKCLCDSSWIVGLESNQTQLAEYFGANCEYRRCPTGDDPSTASDETDCYGISQTSGGGVGLAGNLCHIDCSNRGLCDFSTGVCKCFPGYQGANCGTIEKYRGRITREKTYWPTRDSTNYSITSLL